MLFNLNWQSIILLYLFANLIFSAVVLSIRASKDKNTANTWLAILIWLSALYLIPWMTGHAGWYAHDIYREILFFTPFQQLFLFGPVILLYTLRITHLTWQPSIPVWVHFIPALLYNLYIAGIGIYDLLVADTFFFYADGRDKDLDTWYQLSGFFSIFCYLVISLGIYRKYKQRIYEMVSYADAIRLNWLRNFLLIFFLLIFIRLIFYLLFPQFGDFGSKFWYYLVFAILTLYIAFRGYANTLRLSVSVPDQPWETQLIQQPPHEEENTPDNDLIERIDVLLLTTEVYREPTLNLPDLAQKLSVNTSSLSQAINQGMGVNFNDCINKYRVEWIKNELENGAHHQLSLLGIAYDAGFNSKTTFQRAFKKHTGMTPSQFLGSISE